MKITQKQFNIFKKECKKWIKEFGLYDSKYYFSHEESEEDHVIAYCQYPKSFDDRVFTLILNKEIDADFIKDKDIRRSAFHEVMESMLYPMYYYATQRFIDCESINSENHRIIRILEKVVFMEHVSK